MQQKYPQLRSLDMEQLRETLLDIEADTYAEFIRAGRLNSNLSPVLQEILVESQDKKDKKG
ncbi:MAG: sodium:proton antiporter, partial [Microcystaceae cyanobacterium]